MNREFPKGQDGDATYRGLLELHEALGREFKERLDRSLPFCDEVFDRWERARKLGFGEGSSIYDSALVFGEVTVGRKVWVGPNTILDGSGGLCIGDGCTVAAGVQLYSHDTIRRTLSGQECPVERSEVRVGDCTYLGPYTVVTRGVVIGKHCLVGAHSLVNRTLPDFTIAAGTPARVVGRVVLDGGAVTLDYDL